MNKIVMSNLFGFGIYYAKSRSVADPLGVLKRGILSVHLWNKWYQFVF
jgi:hypothetical protein